MKREGEEYEAQVAQLNASLEDLKENEADLRKKFADEKAIDEGKIKQLKTEKGELEDEKMALVSKLKAAERDVETLESKIKTLEDEITAL